MQVVNWLFYTLPFPDTGSQPFRKDGPLSRPLPMPPASPPASEDSYEEPPTSDHCYYTTEDSETAENGTKLPDN